MLNYIKIIRPFNCFFAALTILFGAFFRISEFEISQILFTVASAVFIAAAGYVINDYYDYEIDCVNRPDRVLPSKKISLNSARNYAFSMFIIGLICAFFTLKIPIITIAIINTILLFLYAKFFKFQILVGNLVVAYSSASTFIYGAFSTENLRNVIMIAVIAFILTFVREIIKDAEDIEGDKEQGANTLAIKIGEKKIVLTSLFVIVTSSLLAFISLKLQLINPWFNYVFIAMNLGVQAVMMVNLGVLTKKKFSHISKLLKIEMFSVLLLYWFLG